MDISELKSSFDAYAFSGRRGWPNLFSSGTRSVIDLGAIGFGGENVVEMPVGTRGVYAASEVVGVPDWFDQNIPTSVYLSTGAGSYSGLRRVYNLRANRNLQFFAPYEDETVTAVYGHCGYMAEVPCEFGGFSVTATDLGIMGVWFSGTCEIFIRSAKGAAYDNKIFSRKLIHRNKVEHMFEPPRHLAPGDWVDLVIGGGGTTRIKLYVRKLA